MKKLVVLLIAVFLLLPNAAGAHPGRTDANGGHTCKTNCEKWGLRYGEYHYHNGGASSSAPATPKVRTPVITKKTVSSEQPITFTEKKEYNSKQYKGYYVTKAEGWNGIKRISTEITYQDGVEISKATPVETVVAQPSNKIVEEGVRIAPLAKITSITKTNKKDKYDISGEYAPNAEVVLSINGKKTKRIKTNDQGKFTYAKIKIKAANPELIVYKRENKKESQISEKTYADLEKLTLKTEYAILNNIN